MPIGIHTDSIGRRLFRLSCLSSLLNLGRQPNLRMEPPVRLSAVTQEIYWPGLRPRYLHSGASGILPGCWAFSFSHSSLTVSPSPYSRVPRIPRPLELPVQTMTIPGHSRVGGCPTYGLQKPRNAWAIRNGRENPGDLTKPACLLRSNPPTNAPFGFGRGGSADDPAHPPRPPCLQLATSSFDPKSGYRRKDLETELLMVMESCSRWLSMSHLTFPFFTDDG